MSRAIKSLMIFVSLFSLAACSQKSVFTVEVLKTPTPSSLPAEPALTATPPSPTFAFTPTAQIPSEPPPIPTVTSASIMPVVEMPSGFSPILYGKKYDGNTFFFLLGGWQGNAWLSPDVASTYFANLSGWDYDVYPLTMGGFQVHGDPPVFSPTSKIYTVGTQITVNEPGMVGVAKGWPVLQRDVQELSPDNEIYQQIVLDWLTTQGIAAPELGNLRVFRVDLEGDGVDEVFISATHLENQHMTKSGDYSIILMRKVQGNNVITLPVVSDVYQSQEMTLPREYSLGNFLDLNRDEILEVIVDIRRWEGDGAFIYQIDGQAIKQVP